MTAIIRAAPVLFLAMEYTIRAIQAEEWAEGLRLWDTVFQPGEWLFDTLHLATEDRKWEHCGVAVDEAGRLVSAVDLFMRPVRGVDGTPTKMAGVGSVATLEEARKQGLSGRLLDRALEVMSAEGCHWSHLFTGTHHHYRRYGWFDAPLRTRFGDLRSDLGSPIEVETLDDAGIDAWLDTFAEWWAHENALRPLVHVRSPHYWKVAIRPRMGQGLIHEDRKVLLIRDQGTPCGYVVYETNPDQPKVLEIAGDAERGLRGFAQTIGTGNVAFDIPFDEPWDSVLPAILEEVELEPAPWSMARGLPGGLGEDEVKSIFAAPGAHHWQLDNF